MLKENVKCTFLTNDNTMTKRVAIVYRDEKRMRFNADGI